MQSQTGGMMGNMQPMQQPQVGGMMGTPPQGQPMQAPMPTGMPGQPTGGGGNKTPMIIGIVVAAIVLLGAGIFLLTRGSDSDEGGRDRDRGNGSSENADRDVSQGGFQERDINYTIEDEAMGHTIIIRRVKLNVPLDFDEDDEFGWNPNDSRSGIAVEVEVINNTEFWIGGSFSSSSLSVTVNGGDAMRGAWGFEDYIEENDIAEFPWSVSRGNTSTGWLFFEADGRLRGDIELVFERAAGTDSDGGEWDVMRVVVPLNR